MGTWGPGAFENDTAGEWLFRLEKSAGLGFVEKTLAAVKLDGEDELEAPQAEKALAACEVLAALLGSPSDDLPPEAETWAEDNAADPSGELIERAIAVIDLVLSNSELKQQWDDSEDGENWQEKVDDLRGRLDENLP
ncbi:MAG TPA: DUF4259 domain-containing protein [Dongiaceae bacterium]|jgi:hypothetical protein